VLTVVLGVIAVAAVLAGADRLTAALAGRRIAHAIGRVLGPGSEPAIRFAGSSFLLQALAGRFREVAITAAALRAGEMDFHSLRAELRDVRAPVRRLLAASASRIVADALPATATIPFAAIARRLAPGLVLTRRGADIAISGRVLLMPVAGTLAVTVTGQRISVVPKVLGVPSLVGFVIPLPGLPPEVSIAGLRVCDDGLEVTVKGEQVNLGSG